MIDRYKNYQQLQEHEQDTFRIHSCLQSDDLIILAIHAGGIEMGTSELAQAIAGQAFSLYLFEGFAPNNQNLHITSTKFDEPGCINLVEMHRRALSLHGFSGNPDDPQVYLGGNDLSLVNKLLDVLSLNGYSAQINNGKYAALAPENICNRTSTRKGVQVELSGELRKQFFADYLHRKGRETRTTEFDRFVHVVRSACLINV